MSVTFGQVFLPILNFRGEIDLPPPPIHLIRNMGLEFSQPLREMSSRRYFWQQNAADE
jgi:hypothetical protein